MGGNLLIIVYDDDSTEKAYVDLSSPPFLVCLCGIFGMSSLETSRLL